MDLEAAREKNAKADRLTLIGMAFCFFLTGGILLGTLAATTSQQPELTIGSSASR
jgi:hypothetical protein